MNTTPPPSRHQLAVMIWLCVFPTLTALNLTFGDWLAPMSPVLRTFVLATAAVPIVIYGLMPHLHRARARLLATAGGDRRAVGSGGGDAPSRPRP
jgi:antibiotic biosynthesis monooxygenase (ABM) superfamily enzyme